MDLERVQTALQHAPLPERMGDFERTRAPQDAAELAGGARLIVEYKHMSEEDVLFQVVLKDEEATLQVVRDGAAEVLNAVSLEEAGHLLRRDLLMILEEIADDL